VTRPEESVRPLEGETLPAVALQETVLPGRGVPPAVSVAVRVWCSPGWRVKLEGETLREVGRPTEGPE
jgi:hypothetical protein